MVALLSSATVGLADGLPDVPPPSSWAIRLTTTGVYGTDGSSLTCGLVLVQVLEAVPFPPPKLPWNAGPSHHVGEVDVAGSAVTGSAYGVKAEEFVDATGAPAATPNPNAKPPAAPSATSARSVFRAARR